MRNLGNVFEGAANLYEAHLEDNVHLNANFVHIRTGAIRMAAHQLEYGRHDVRHLVARYQTVAVDVVQLKRPLEFLFDAAA